MEPIATSAVAFALAQGFSHVGNRLLEQGVIEPALEPAVDTVKNWLQKTVVSQKKDEVLRQAVRSAIEDYQRITGDTDLQVQTLLSSLNILTEERNSALRAEVARTLWLMDGPDPAQMPEALPSILGLPSRMRGPLAAFLWQLKRQLATQAPFQLLFAFDHDVALRHALDEITDYLAQLADTVEPTAKGPAVRVLPVEQEPDTAEIARLRRAYLDYVAASCRWLEFTGIMQVRNIPKLPMAEVFVPLNALDQTWQSDRESWEVERVDQKVSILALLPRYPRLVILGDPGSGKTTFLKYIALALAEGPAAARNRLGLNFDTKSDTDPWLPLLFPIAAYIAVLKQKPGLAMSDFLPDFFRGHELPRMGPLLRAELAAGKCLLLMDGLDEVGSPGDRRLASSRVNDLVRAYPGNRFVITSRIAGYDQAPLNSDEFMHVTIQPFDDDDIARFARQWCLAYEQRGDTISPAAKARAETRADRLVNQIRSDSNITRLAANPLLLSILALIHYQGTQLPRRRMELYSLCVKTLAETWNLARGLSDRPINLYLGDEPLDERFVADVLGPVAFWMHEYCPERVIERRDLEERVARRLTEYGQMSEIKARGLADDFIQLMVEKTGLLSPCGLDLFGFLHLTFEEYLAARYLIDWLDYKAEAKRLVADPRWWEVIRLSAAALTGRRVAELISAVLDANLKNEHRGRDIVLAGWSAVDASRAAVGRPLMDRLILRLEQVMRGTDDDGQPCVPPLIPSSTRADAGRVLADLAWLPSDIHDMIDVPDGEFLMGSSPEEIEQLMAEAALGFEVRKSKSEDWEPGEVLDRLRRKFDGEAPRRCVYVPAFRIAKYPVINSQFRHFIEDGGYYKEAYWSEEGLAWLNRSLEEEASLPDYRRRAGRMEPGYWRDTRFNRPNAPVVGVTWYEAAAYCRWLSVREGKNYHLPTEAMWEKTARGGLQIPLSGYVATPLSENPLPQRRYTWGDTFDPERANTDADEIGEPTAIGVYPLGASPYGVQDMIGNVWEWCSDHPEHLEHQLEASKTDDFRSLRGGAWFSFPWRTRCASRGILPPDSWGTGVGFRVAQYM